MSKGEAHGRNDEFGRIISPDAPKTSEFQWQYTVANKCLIKKSQPCDISLLANNQNKWKTRPAIAADGEETGVRTFRDGTTPKQRCDNILTCPDCDVEVVGEFLHGAVLVGLGSRRRRAGRDKKARPSCQPAAFGSE